jgi:N-acetylglucosaminyl-diphospho-decaprenol L-rhamnosyltransferase
MTPASESDVAVIIIGRNARDYVKNSLQSLQAAEWKRYSSELIYVDNGSTDGTHEMLREFPQVRAIFNEQNLGFCKAGNQAVAIAQSRYYFFLNDDTIVLGDAIARLIDLLDTTEGAGVAGARLLYPDMSEQWSGRRFPTPLNGILGRRSLLTRLFPNSAPVRRYLFKDQIRGEHPFAVDWVSAAAMMVRRETFHKVGGLAEDYYYFHEAVFCRRVARAGWKTYLHPQSRIIHYEGKGSGSRPFGVQRWHVKDFHSGAFRFYCEHHSLGRVHPARWAIAAVMSGRAAILIAGHSLASLKRFAAR